MNTDCMLDERLGLSTGPAVIREALYAQRSRFIATLKSFGPSEWAAGTRCTGWSAHDVARHVADVAELDIARLAGGTLERFLRHGPFQPHTSPVKWLEDTAGQETQETVKILAERAEDEYACFSRRIEENDEASDFGVLGRPNHWSVLSLHVYWDAWMHERDIAIPVGLEIRSSVEELRLMAMYSALLAAQPTVISGEHLRVSLVLRGSPDAVYHIDGDPDDISVTAGTSTPIEVVEGELGVVLDSLVGRGPEPTAVLTGPADAVEKLARLRPLATGETPILRKPFEVSSPPIEKSHGT
jgi:uncharacterized protein (TIGR03083 family)